MNQLTTQQDRTPMDSVSVSTTATGSKIAPQNLGEVVKFAEVMARADIALPKHLRGNPGACMAVAMQALEWQMSPFAVASKSYSVGGSIAYEAQLIAAVVNTRSGIKGRLRYHFEGEGAALTCRVTGVLDGEECVYTSPTIGSITTKNSPLWKSDPQQQLGYFAARSWARRHCPEVILGVYDRDEAEEFRGPERAKDVTPIFNPLDDEPIAQPQRPDSERETTARTYTPDPNDFTSDDLTGEIIEPDPETPEPGARTAPESDEPPVPPAQSQEAGDNVLNASPASDLFPMDRADLVECARKMFAILVTEGLTPETQRKVLVSSKDDWKAKLPGELHEHIKEIVTAADDAIRGRVDRLQAIRNIATRLGCTPAEIGGA